MNFVKSFLPFAWKRNKEQSPEGTDSIFQLKIWHNRPQYLEWNKDKYANDSASNFFYPPGFENARPRKHRIEQLTDDYFANVRFETVDDPEAEAHVYVIFLPCKDDPPIKEKMTPFNTIIFSMQGESFVEIQQWAKKVNQPPSAIISYPLLLFKELLFYHEYFSVLESHASLVPTNARLPVGQRTTLTQEEQPNTKGEFSVEISYQTVSSDTKCPERPRMDPVNWIAEFLRDPSDPSAQPLGDVYEQKPLGPSDKPIVLTGSFHKLIQDKTHYLFFYPVNAARSGALDNLPVLRLSRQNLPFAHMFLYTPFKFVQAASEEEQETVEIIFAEKENSKEAYLQKLRENHYKPSLIEEAKEIYLSTNLVSKYTGTLSAETIASFFLFPAFFGTRYNLGTPVKVPGMENWSKKKGKSNDTTLKIRFYAEKKVPKDEAVTVDELNTCLEIMEENHLLPYDFRFVSSGSEDDPFVAMKEGKKLETELDESMELAYKENPIFLIISLGFLLYEYEVAPSREVADAS